MSDSKMDPGDRAMFWFNVIGGSVAAALIGTFFVKYGADFFALIVIALNPDRMPDMP
jgi:hypothetical protein